jgi:hypothetical protein
MTPETRRFATQANEKYWKQFHAWFRVVKPTGNDNVLPVGRK